MRIGETVPSEAGCRWGLLRVKLEWCPPGDLDKELVTSEIQEGRGGRSLHPRPGTQTLREAGTRDGEGSRGWVQVSLGSLDRAVSHLRRVGEGWRGGRKSAPGPRGESSWARDWKPAEAGVPGMPQTRTTQVAQAAASSSSAALRAQGSRLQTRPGGATRPLGLRVRVARVLECMASCGRLQGRVPAHRPL